MLQFRRLICFTTRCCYVDITRHIPCRFFRFHGFAAGYATSLTSLPPLRLFSPCRCQLRDAPLRYDELLFSLLLSYVVIYHAQPTLLYYAKRYAIRDASHCHGRYAMLMMLLFFSVMLIYMSLSPSMLCH